jgi:hypothetical protein
MRSLDIPSATPFGQTIVDRRLRGARFTVRIDPRELLRISDASRIRVTRRETAGKLCGDFQEDRRGNFGSLPDGYDLEETEKAHAGRSQLCSRTRAL